MAVVSVVAAAADSQATWRAARVWHPALWQIWLGVSALLLLANLPDTLAGLAPEPDDYLRLAQVRDWLAGQDWYDSRQYRMNPPYGADIHWVRLVDIPIAGFMTIFRLFLEQRVADTAAMVAVPLTQLAIAMLLLRALMRRLGQSQAEIDIGAVIIPLMPLLSFTFMPMRIDHHGWQAICSMVMVWMLVRGGYRDALVAGFVAATLLFISVEGMPIVAAIGTLFGARYWSTGERGHEGFLFGLAAGSLALFFVLRPATTLSLAYCDMLSWPHFLAFATSAAVACASRALPGRLSSTGRLLSMLPIPLVAAPVMIAPLGICAVSPMATLDPMLRTNWFNHLIESAPVWRQTPSAAAMLFAGIVIVLIGAHLAHRRWRGTANWEGWALLTMAALAAGAVSLLVMRAAITLQLLALPFAALILAELLPRARTIEGAFKRILATFVCFIIATPALATAAFKPFDSRISYTLVRHPALGADGECKLDALENLPPAMMFASLDMGAQIVARTPHSVVMGGYHRNQAKMKEVFEAFGGPLNQARDIVLANRSLYLVTCTSSPDLAAYANMGPDNLADRIFAGNPPDWLIPVTGLDNRALRLYRVVDMPTPAGSPSLRRSCSSACRSARVRR